jgi:hypothetical protein
MGFDIWLLIDVIRCPKPREIRGGSHAVILKISGFWHEEDSNEWKEGGISWHNGSFQPAGQKTEEMQVVTPESGRDIGVNLWTPGLTL